MIFIKIKISIFIIRLRLIQLQLKSRVGMHTFHLLVFPVGSSIELKAFGSLGSSTELKTIKVKINDEVVLTSSSDSITSLWLTKNKSVVTDEGSDTQVDSGEVFYHINLDMIKSSTQSCLSSGYTGLSGSPIENITVSETSVDCQMIFN